MSPMVGDCSARPLALNRGSVSSRLICVHPPARAAVRDLLAVADVFVHNWALGKAATFGLDSGDFAGANPGLVYAYASGWGEARGSEPSPGTDFMASVGLVLRLG
ncbi:CoA transferase [Phytohabitans sp. ZYX-F-186]|uniref:CoA transferase n=1 Tax=Phytohabitans maris TaxID=3071409 RepID=A0ABU0ZS39_9ACTN|nr:CoA transferase [Phytohabitans sp. ZYX-F-186]MDQ7909790.1 CoA transferase [Phytohabitans sp. ZYX-F-186]